MKVLWVIYLFRFGSFFTIIYAYFYINKIILFLLITFPKMFNFEKYRNIEKKKKSPIFSPTVLTLMPLVEMVDSSLPMQRSRIGD